MTPAGKPLAGLGVLVVEDHEDSLESLAQSLELLGAAVATALSAHDAMLTMTEMVPDVVLTDLHLGHETGFQLLGRIRAHANPLLSRVPVVAITGRREYAEKVHHVPFSAAVGKPVVMETLVGAIQRVLRAA